jgi:hypothetical protein
LRRAVAAGDATAALDVLQAALGEFSPSPAAIASARATQLSVSAGRTLGARRLRA